MLLLLDKCAVDKNIHNLKAIKHVDLSQNSSQFSNSQQVIKSKKNTAAIEN